MTDDPQRDRGERAERYFDEVDDGTLRIDSIADRVTMSIGMWEHIIGDALLRTDRSEQETDWREWVEERIGEHHANLVVLTKTVSEVLAFMRTLKTQRRRTMAEKTSVEREYMPGQNLGSVVRRLRTAGGLSQKDLADALEVDHTYISHLEANRREPSIKLLRRLASALDVPAGLLLALVIWTDLAPEERSTYENLISRLVDAALVAQLKLPMLGDEEGATTAAPAGSERKEIP